MTKFSTTVDNESKVDKIFDVYDVSKIDDVSNIVVVDVNCNVISRNRLNNCEINEILNRREFLKNESSDKKTKTINFDSSIDIKLKKIENSFFLSKRKFFFSIVFCCLFIQVL